MLNKETVANQTFYLVYNQEAMKNCAKGEKSPKDLKSKGETKDWLDYGLQQVALCGGSIPIMQDRADTGKQHH